MDNLSLIDWGDLAANALWIIGLGLALAAMSFASFEASTGHLRLKDVLTQNRFEIILDLAGILFCSGLAATSSQLIALILWIILAALFLISIVLSLRNKSIPIK
ncbi:MAG: hypothetical protein P4L50_12710 [Anaerolineaceae bacterium]|nr:hypothetical protein [Anaerolineaceae bacterium]